MKGACNARPFFYWAQYYVSAFALNRYDRIYKDLIIKLCGAVDERGHVYIVDQLFAKIDVLRWLSEVETSRVVAARKAKAAGVEITEAEKTQ
jgi:hypothetical protein